MNQDAPSLPHTPAPTDESLRESLGVLLLSTDILRCHAASLEENERLAQREIMREAGARLTAALARCR